MCLFKTHMTEMLDYGSEVRAMDKKVENIKALQAELEHRTAVEKLAEKMIIDGKFEEAKELLDTLDDDKARELMEECPDEEIKEVRTMDKRVKLEEKAVMDIMKILTQGGISVKQSKSILDRVNVIFMESSKNFLDDCDAKEVLGTSSRYDVFKV